MQTSAPGMGYYSIASSADGQLLAAGSSGGSVEMSTNGGATWSNAGSHGEYIACSADGTKLFAANQGGAGHVNISTNSGKTWATAINSPAVTWESIACSADGTKLTGLVNGGLIYTSTNSGTTWITDSAPYTNWQCVASSADGTRLAAVYSSGSNGGIYSSTNSGTTWTSNSVVSQKWLAVAASADGNKLVGAPPNLSSGGVYIWYCAPIPSINLLLTNGGFTLSWLVPATNFVLQSSCDLCGWTDLTNAPVLNFTNLQNEVTLSATNSNIFYRLKAP